jgi:hypothetical protein
MWSDSSNSSLRLVFKKSEIRIHSEDRGLLAALREDFFHFLPSSPEPTEALVPRDSFKYSHSVKVFAGGGEERKTAEFPWSGRPRPGTAFPFQRGFFWGWGRRRFVSYFDGSLLELESSKASRKEMKFWGRDAEALKPLVSLMIQALWGEDLEREGCTRFHALAYGKEGVAGLVCADSGLGKSTTALRMLKENKAVVLSDEIGWVKDRGIESYPLPVWEKGGDGTKKGHRLPPESLKRRLALKEIFCVFRRDEVPYESPLALRLLFLFKIVEGRHLPQMTEFLLRGNNLFFLAGLFFARLRRGFSYAFLTKVRFLRTERFLSWEELVSESDILGT